MKHLSQKFYNCMLTGKHSPFYPLQGPQIKIGIISSPLSSFLSLASISFLLAESHFGDNILTSVPIFKEDGAPPKSDKLFCLQSLNIFLSQGCRAQVREAESQQFLRDVNIYAYTLLHWCFPDVPLFISIQFFTFLNKTKKFSDQNLCGFTFISPLIMLCTSLQTIFQPYFYPYFLLVWVKFLTFFPQKQSGSEST